MPKMISIFDLKDVSAVSKLCNESDEPVYIIQNGHDDMVIMSMKAYEKKLEKLDVYEMLTEAEADIAAGRTLDGKTVLRQLRERYHI